MLYCWGSGIVLICRSLGVSDLRQAKLARALAPDRANAIIDGRARWRRRSGLTDGAAEREHAADAHRRPAETGAGHVDRPREAFQWARVPAKAARRTRRPGRLRTTRCRNWRRYRWRSAHTSERRRWAAGTRRDSTATGSNASALTQLVRMKPPALMEATALPIRAGPNRPPARGARWQAGPPPGREGDPDGKGRWRFRYSSQAGAQRRCLSRAAAAVPEKDARTRLNRP